jgi:Domain of unknown function (DUF3597)
MDRAKLIGAFRACTAKQARSRNIFEAMPSRAAQNQEFAMGIFSSIKDAIFGHAAQAAPMPVAVETAAPAPAPAPEVVDIEAVMTGLEASHPGLNWRVSIVDLMKMLDLDSSHAHRLELASELGFPGDTSDSASMNIWLHKQVMSELEANGGKVPSDLK